MGLEILATTLAASATGVPQAIEGRRARKEEKKAKVVERQIADVKAARERRRQIREARIARAEVETAAVATGTGGSSSAVSGAGNVGTQLASNLSFLDTVEGLEAGASLFREKASNRRASASEFEAVGRATRSAFHVFGGGA